VLPSCISSCNFFKKKWECGTNSTLSGNFCYSTLVQYTRETNTFSETSCKTSCSNFLFL